MGVMAGDDGGDGGARHSDGHDVDGSGSERSGDAWRRPQRRTESPPLSIGTVRSGGPPPAPQTLGGSQPGTAWSWIDPRTPCAGARWAVAAHQPPPNAAGGRRETTEAAAHPPPLL